MSARDPLDDSHLFEPAVCDRCGVALDRGQIDCIGCMGVVSRHRECERRLRAAGFFRVSQNGNDWVWRCNIGSGGLISGKIELSVRGERRIPEPGERVSISRYTGASENGIVSDFETIEDAIAALSL